MKDRARVDVKMAEVPDIVVRRLQANGEVGVHPDVDALAAFVERSLNQREQTDILEHLAHCAECREVVALALPAQVDAAASLTAISPSGWLSWPVLRWSAVAACVVVVGAAVTLHYESVQTGRHITTPASDVAVVQNKALASAPNESGTGAALPSEPTPPRKVPTPAPAPAQQNLDRAEIAHNAPIAADRLQAEAAKQEAAGVSAAAPLLAKTEPPTAMIPGRAKDESQLPAARLKMSLGGATPSRQRMASSAMIARAATIPANVIPRWTLTSEGMLQRSIDSGKTWETILVANPGTFRALTANGLDIWVGGAKGALYHSIDAGQQWMQVQPVAGGEPLKTDIIGIEFPDLMHGTLTTADKQTWITADAGQTWMKQ